jgi:hypothetical protein
MKIAVIFGLAGQAIWDGETMDVQETRDAYILNETAIFALASSCRPATIR